MLFLKRLFIEPTRKKLSTELKPEVKPETKLKTILWSIECGFEWKREKSKAYQNLG